MSKSKTYIVFFLLLLLACQAESSELKTSVLVDEAVDKGIKFVAKKTKKWFGKKKNKPDNEKKGKDKEKDEKELTLAEKKQKVKIGLRFLHEQENNSDKDKNGELTKEEATKIAKKTKAKHNIFQWIKVTLSGKKWAYKYKYNPEETEISNKEVDDGKPSGIKKAKQESADIIAKIEPLLKKDETVKRDFEPSLKIIKGDWNDYVDLVKSIKNNQDEKDIIDGFKDVLKKATELKVLVNKRIPDEEKVDDERAIVLEILKKSTHRSPQDYRRHWKGKGEEGRRQASITGDGQFLYSLSNADVEKLEIEAIKKGRIVKHSNSTYHIFHTFDDFIGYASGGKKTKYMRAEITNIGASKPIIHSHPR